jgi:uncharacterized protein (TIGR03032 family)
MKRVPTGELDALWARHHAEWRDQAQIISQWREAAQIDPKLLAYSVRGAWWQTLAQANVTLLVTREYEHLVMALSVDEAGPRISYMPLPHPSGLAVDRQRGVVHVASTRNPNQIYDLAPVTGVLPRGDIPSAAPPDQPLVPLSSRFLPGSLYMHDLAVIGGALYANAVGHNAVVRLDDDGQYERVWWPRSIETAEGPVFSRNHLQLNSIAAGERLADSFFSASTNKVSARRPGHKNFPVDRRGVIYSGATREPIAYGLTRPHSARLHGGRIWVDNSGYGELGIVAQERFVPVARLPGWTRGLSFHGGVAFVGTSRVIPRFRQYAPGLDVDASRCGIHAVDVGSGRLLGSLYWPYGNQIFAIEWLGSSSSAGFPFSMRRRAGDREKALFYAFQTDNACPGGMERAEG